MQTRFGAQARIADLDPFLMTVLVQQSGGIQIQRIAAGPAGQPFQAPAPEGAEGGQIFPGRVEALEKAGEAGLAADALDFQERRQHDIAAQVGDLSQLLRPGQNAGEKAHRQIGHRDRFLALALMGQDFG